jgi:hypothetical protein
MKAQADASNRVFDQHRQRVPLGADPGLRTARTGGVQLGYQPAVDHRDRPGSDQRGQGAVLRRVAGPKSTRPAAEVFAYATDPTLFSKWQKGMVDGHVDGPANGAQTPGVGASCVTTRRIGGDNRPATSELVNIDPPKTWAARLWRTATRPANLSGDVGGLPTG